MTTIHRTGQQAHLTLRDTEPRVTPAPPSRQFSETLGEGAQVLLEGVEQAAGLLPGGNAVAAAIRTGRAASQGEDGPSAGVTGSGASPARGAGAAAGMVGDSAQTAYDLIALQQQIAMEQRMFQTTSNVLKARHDTSKAVIQNVR